MYGMNKKKLQLIPYDPVWKADFAAERLRIFSAAEDSIIQIEHIGSTSIPGIYAKPILDIAVLCADQAFENVITGLKSLGYKFRGQFDDEISHYYAVLEQADTRLCQAHIYDKAVKDFHLKIKFRDTLRKNAELAREYNDYKRHLAKTVSGKTEYAEIKTKWVDEFILKVL